MDDIVTRLRDIETYVECWKCTEYGFLKNKPSCECEGQDDLRQSAADEIEHLRDELKQWQALCDTYYHKLALEPDNTLYFIFGYRYLAAGGK